MIFKCFLNFLASEVMCFELKSKCAVVPNMFCFRFSFLLHNLWFGLNYHLHHFYEHFVSEFICFEPKSKKSVFVS